VWDGGDPPSIDLVGQNVMGDPIGSVVATAFEGMTAMGRVAWGIAGRGFVGMVVVGRGIGVGGGKRSTCRGDSECKKAIGLVGIVVVEGECVARVD
jgi:hypothetical protein